MTSLSAETARRALDLARFAPSAHNTQPWRVASDGGRLVVSIDPRRHLAHSDPMERDLRLALGGFVEALGIALRAEGVAAERADPPAGAFAALAPAGACDREAEAASLLRRRQTSRLAYAPRDLEPAAADALAAAARDQGLDLHLVPKGTPERARLDGLFFAATREAWLDARAVAELRRWVRFDPEGARAPADGLSTHCLGLGTMSGLGAMLAVREAPWRILTAAFAAPLWAERLAATETTDVAAAPYLGLLLRPSADPAPGIASGSVGAAGAGLLRTWLAATKLGLALHPISALLDRRGWEVARHLGVATGRVLFAFRLGRSAPPPRSGRLAVERFAKV
jgi:hypothetical protein